MIKDAFISHSTKDAATAQDICRLLEDRGLACWIAPRDVVPGKNFAEAIIDGIETTRATILVLSEHANDSVHVRNEVERAVAKGKAVFPIRVREVQPSKALELFISSAQWIDAWGSPLDDRIDRLAAAIGSLSGAAVTTGASSASGAAPRPRTAPARRGSPLPWAIAALVLVAGGGGAWWSVTRPSAPPPPVAGTLSVAPVPSNADVLVDGVRTDEPSAISIPAGTHTVDVQAPGYDPQQQVVSITAGQHESLIVKLSPVARRPERQERAQAPRQERPERPDRPAPTPRAQPAPTEPPSFGRSFAEGMGRSMGENVGRMFGAGNFPHR